MVNSIVNLRLDHDRSQAQTLTAAFIVFELAVFSSRVTASWVRL